MNCMCLLCVTEQFSVFEKLKLVKKEFPNDQFTLSISFNIVLGCVLSIMLYSFVFEILVEFLKNLFCH